SAVFPSNRPAKGASWFRVPRRHPCTSPYCRNRSSLAPQARREPELAPLAAELLGERDLLACHPRHVLEKHLGLGDALALDLRQLGHHGLEARALIRDRLLQ